MSWPVFTWYDADSEISSVEVEEVFSINLKVSVYSPVLQPTSKTVLTTIPELNANHGFDPVQGGADVCKYFGWPLMEILNGSTGGWMPLHDSVSESASVTSDNRNQTLSELTVSSLEIELEGEHAGKALTRIEITTPVPMRDQKLYHGLHVDINSDNICRWIEQKVVPEELIRPRLEELWRMEGGITDIVLCDELQKVFDTLKYTLGLSSFKRMRKHIGFLSTRQQDHMVETITESIEELREHFPKAGYFELKKHLQIDHKLCVSSFGYESLLQYGVDQGWYDPKYVVKNNTTKKRHNRKIAHPNGIPLLIKQALERFDAQDYKVTFSPESIQTARQLYAPIDHPMLELIPESF
ncbi:hypothetical protein ARMGADRAFT_1022931 [Armillaria gallica]|uniref:Uncharacterized protein n=1 Tax=Armillaria gallica TaxID=47427 RepID=A0A2H3EZ14_ARMGA|nr:hypothetical protein ARMGADRAFT_1022931 [Armillaria gallica]